MKCVHFHRECIQTKKYRKRSCVASCVSRMKIKASAVVMERVLHLTRAEFPLMALQFDMNVSIRHKETFCGVFKLIKLKSRLLVMVFSVEFNSFSLCK